MKKLIAFIFLNCLMIFSMNTNSANKCNVCWKTESHLDHLHFRRIHSSIFMHPEIALEEIDNILNWNTKRESETFEKIYALRAYIISIINTNKSDFCFGSIYEQYDYFNNKTLNIKKVNELKRKIINNAILNDYRAIKFLQMHPEIKISSKKLRQIPTN